MDEVYTFAVTTPAGTAQTAPLTTALTMPVRVVRRVEFVVPPGPSGALGWRLGMAGQQIVPVNTGGWIVTDDERGGWDLANLPTSGAWQAYTYNTGTQPHTLYLRFLVDVPRPAQAPIYPSAIPAAQLAPVPDALLAVAQTDWSAPQAPPLDLTDPATAALVLGVGG